MFSSPSNISKISSKSVITSSSFKFNVSISVVGYWNKEDVNRLLKGIGETDEINEFKDAVSKEEEVLIMNYGGVYYEDMTEEEYANVLETEDAEHCKIITLIEQIAGVNDNLRDLFLELSNLIGMRELNNKKTIIDDTEIKSEEISKYKEYLEEIRKFALYV